MYNWVLEQWEILLENMIIVRENQPAQINGNMLNYKMNLTNGHICNKSRSYGKNKTVFKISMIWMGSKFRSRSHWKIRLLVFRLIFHTNYTLTKYANIVSDWLYNNETLQKINPIKF